KPLGSVTVTIANHKEYGSTQTRGDGFFDLAVNGGGSLVVQYARDGYLPAQRRLPIVWQEYAVAPTVALIQPDGAVTAVTMGSSKLQVARGSRVSDASGARQATLLFPSGTTAQAPAPGGGMKPVGSLHVRLPEVTV